MNKKTRRNYKDSIFRRLFDNEDILIELYNALSGSNYPTGTKVEIVTLDNIIFNGIKNDLAFIIDNRFVVLTEQQSTLSPNFPVRLFCYLGKVYESIIPSKELYSTKLVEIPTPELYVFYNGVQDAPLEYTMKLSDAFKEKSDIISIEAIVKVINVNYEKGADLLNRCKTLQAYSAFVYRARQLYAEHDDIEFAITESVREFIEDETLGDFLMKHRGSIMSVLEINLTQEEQIEIRVQDNSREIAKAFKEDGIPVEIIAKNTGLSIEEVEAL